MENWFVCNVRYLIKKNDVCAVNNDIPYFFVFKFFYLFNAIVRNFYILFVTLYTWCWFVNIKYPFPLFLFPPFLSGNSDPEECWECSSRLWRGDRDEEAGDTDGTGTSRDVGSAEGQVNSVWGGRNGIGEECVWFRVGWILNESNLNCCNRIYTCWIGLRTSCSGWRTVCRRFDWKGTSCKRGGWWLGVFVCLRGECEDTVDAFHFTLLCFLFFACTGILYCRSR